MYTQSSIGNLKSCLEKNSVTDILSNDMNIRMLRYAIRIPMNEYRSQRADWRTILGRRLQELRLRAHGGKGYTQEKAAETIGKSRGYLNSMETRPHAVNPSIQMLEQLCSLYGVTMADLFAPIVRESDTKLPSKHPDLTEKLHFILDSGVSSTAIGIEENILAMYERVLKKKRS